MSEHMTEREQIEQIKKWWARYGRLTITSFLVALVLVLGWHYEQSRQEKISNQASLLYQQMFELAGQGGADAQVRANAEVLMTRYAKTPYADSAALMLAKLDVQAKDYAGAEKSLRWILTNGRDASLKQVARLRLARILIAEKRPADALTLLNTVDNPAFIGAIDLVKGDALIAEGQPAAAREQYRLALQVLPQDSLLTPIVMMKYNQLAGAAPTPAATPAASAAVVATPNAATATVVVGKTSS